MFLFHHVRPLTKQEEAQVIYDMVKTIQYGMNHYILPAHQAAFAVGA